jgi:hypothetical protein
MVELPMEISAVRYPGTARGTSPSLCTSRTPGRGDPLPLEVFEALGRPDLYQEFLARLETGVVEVDELTEIEKYLRSKDLT